MTHGEKHYGSKCPVYKDDPKFTCKHPDCIFTGGNAHYGNKCDYMYITGTSRIKGLTGEARKPINCPFYVSKNTKEGQKRLEEIKELKARREAAISHGSPCWNCPSKIPGCDCEMRRKYVADRDSKAEERLLQADINNYTTQTINRFKANHSSVFGRKYNTEE